MTPSNTIEQRDPATLQPHPKSRGEAAKGTGDYKRLLDSIRAKGIQEPLIISETGLVYSGHMRLECALDLNLPTVPCRVHPPFESENAEALYIICANTERCQFTPEQAVKLYSILIGIPVEQGGAKLQRGGKRKNAGRKKNQPGNIKNVVIAPPSSAAAAEQDKKVKGS